MGSQRKLERNDAVARARPSRRATGLPPMTPMPTAMARTPTARCTKPQAAMLTPKS
jgi:hypothetical protein